MENHKFQELVLQQLQSLTEGQKVLTDEQKALTEGQKVLTEGQKVLVEGQNSLISRMDNLEKSQDKLAAELMTVKTDVQEVKTTVTKLENDLTPKIGALFDGYTLRGDQIENLRKHMEERLDSIETDTGYLVSKVARLEKLAK